MNWRSDDLTCFTGIIRTNSNFNRKSAFRVVTVDTSQVWSVKIDQVLSLHGVLGGVGDWLCESFRRCVCVVPICGVGTLLRLA